jgi:hypothetical protein
VQSFPVLALAPQLLCQDWPTKIAASRNLSGISSSGGNLFPCPPVAPDPFLRRLYRRLLTGRKRWSHPHPMPSRQADRVLCHAFACLPFSSEGAIHRARTSSRGSRSLHSFAWASASPLCSHPLSCRSGPARSCGSMRRRHAGRARSIVPLRTGHGRPVGAPSRASRSLPLFRLPPIPQRGRD